MKCNRYTEEQIIRLLKEHGAGLTIEELTPKHGNLRAGLLQEETHLAPVVLRGH